MKTNLKIRRLFFFIMLFVVVTSCETIDDGSDDENTTTQDSASYKINGTIINASNTYLGIFNDEGVINNTITLTAADNSELTLKFEGTTPKTQTLSSYYDATYTNAAGDSYYATNGELVITEYQNTDNSYKASGTFHVIFNASSGNDSLSVVEGVFMNVSN